MDIGNTLREKRQELNLTVETAARLSKIPNYLIEALENNQFQHLSPKTTPRILKEYAQTLELDPEPLLLAYVTQLSEKESRQNVFKNKLHQLWSRQYLGLYLLTGIALIIIGSIFFLTYKERQKGPLIQRPETVNIPTATTTTTTEEEETTTQTTEKAIEQTPPPKKEVEKTPVVMDVDEKNIGKNPIIPLTVKGVKDKVNLMVQVEENRCWVRVGANGLVVYNDTLEANKKAKVTLEKGTKKAQLVLGAAAFAKVKIAGQALPDLKKIGPNPVTFEITLEE